MFPRVSVREHSYIWLEGLEVSTIYIVDSDITIEIELGTLRFTAAVCAISTF